MTTLGARPRRPVLPSAGLLITAILLILTGCTPPSADDDSPSPGNTPTKSANAKPPPLPRPTMPDLAQKKTAQGSAAFARYYYSLVAYGHETGHWEQLKKLSLPSCTRCTDFWSSSGSRFRTNDIVILRGTDVDPMGVREDRTVLVMTVYAGPRSMVADRHPKYLPNNFRGWSDTANLVYTEHGWRVEQLEVLQIES